MVNPAPKGRAVPHEVDLFDQIGRLLQRREGWHFEPSPTPGLSPSWCLDPGGEIALAVNVIDGAVCVYAPSGDREIRLGGVDDLAAWIERNEVEFLRS
jgi:hypothetical protein